MKNIVRKIHNIDATDQSIGRMASNIALILRGKNKSEYEPQMDCGDIVKVANIKKVKFTGKKLDQKKYFSYSGYPGGLKTKKMSVVMVKNPGEVLKKAVRDMLPPVKFRNNMLRRLIIK
jgi:large subunit ribosomal protein L13